MTPDVPSTDDAELLRRFTEGHREDAFAQLVHRHIDLVHAAALRILNGDAAAAADVAQAVFIELARQADSLTRHPALVGWLYTTTHRQASHWIRAEVRRQHREQKAHEFLTMHQPADPESDWSRLRPVLDDALMELGDSDRLVLLLRHFERHSHAEVGRRLGLGENAARMRGERALQRLASCLGRRGITSTGTALSVALGSGPTLAAPTGLAAKVTAGALAASVTTCTNLGLLALMTTSKAKIAAVAAGFGLLGTGLLVQQQALGRLRQERDTLAGRLATGTPSAAPAQTSASTRPTTTAPDPEALAELLRLRGEVARLRRELGTRTVPASPLPRTHAPSLPPTLSWAPGDVLAQADWQDFGNATPQAAVATHLWALRHGDLTRLAEISNIGPETIGKLQKLPGNAVVEALGMNRILGARLIEARETRPDTYEIQYEASFEGDLPPGMTSGFNHVQVVRSGNEWKILLPPPLGTVQPAGQ